MDDGFSGYGVGKIEQLSSTDDPETINTNTQGVPLIDPKVGDYWYVQLGPRATLVERKVLDVTPLTILLEEDKICGSYESRYVRSELT